MNRVDFCAVINVVNANPNGDPVNSENMPRVSFDNLGEMSEGCIKRKIRDRMVERLDDLIQEGKNTDGQDILYQRNDKKLDDFNCIKKRVDSKFGKAKMSLKEKIAFAHKTWLDVRAFGGVLAFKASKGATAEDEDSKAESTNFYGAVSIRPVLSLEEVHVSAIKITKSMNGELDSEKKAEDTMGTKYRVDKGIYMLYGSINSLRAKQNGFDEKDAEVLKNILPRIFENDESSARPAGSMSVLKTIWWQHNCRNGQQSSKKSHESVKVDKDGVVTIEPTLVTPEVIDEF